MTLHVAHEVSRGALSNRTGAMGMPACLHKVVLEQVFAVLNVVGVGGPQLPGPPVVAQEERLRQHLVFRMLNFELYVAKLLRPHPESKRV